MLNKVPKYILYVFICISPLLDYYLISFSDGFLVNIDSTRIKTIPIFSSISLLSSTLIYFKLPRLITKSTFVIGLITILLIISLLYSKVNIESQLSYLILILLTVMLGLSASSTLKRSQESFQMFVIIFCTFAFVIFLVKLYLSGFNVQVARGGLNVYTISGVVTFLLFYFIFLTTRESDQNILKQQYFVIFSIFFASLISANRAGLLSSIAITTIILVKQSRFLSIFYIVFLGSVFIIIFDDIYILKRFSYDSFSYERLLEIIFASRVSYWNEAFDLISLNPMGVGLGGYHIASIYNLDSAHNFFLNILVEQGYVIGFLLLASIIFILRHSLTKDNVFYYLVLIVYLFISGWTLIQPVGMLSAFNLLLLILFSKATMSIKNVKF
jgi:hypothetical protein